MTACAHYEIVPSGKAAIILKAGQTMTAPHDGVYLPDELYLEMTQAIEDKLK